MSRFTRKLVPDSFRNISGRFSALTGKKSENAAATRFYSGPRLPLIIPLNYSPDTITSFFFPPLLADDYKTRDLP